MAVHFDIADQGRPKLAGEDAEMPESPAGVNQPESNNPVPGDVVWSPEEVQGILQTVLNFGVFFYGPEWLCGPGDFLRSAPNAARLMERVFPKATTGGPIGIGVDVAAVASDLGASLAARRQLMKKGPKQGKQILEEFGLGQEAKPVDPERTAPPPPPAQPVAAGDSVPTDSSSFKFSPQVAAALGRASQGGLVEMGLLPT